MVTSRLAWPIGIAITVIGVVSYQIIHAYAYLAPDSFTYFAMARNVFETGLWYSYSGIDHTTGIHPLYYFVLVLVYPFAGMLLPEWSFVLNALLIGIGIWFCYKAYGKYVALIILSSVLVAQGAASTNNGMESSLLFCLLGIVVFLFNRYKLSVTHSLLLGSALGLSILARLDTIFLVAVFGAYLGLVFLFSQGVRSIPNLILLGLPVVVCLLLSAFLTYQFDGTLLPLSGSLKSSLPNIQPLWYSSILILKVFIASLITMGGYTMWQWFRKKRIEPIVGILFGGNALLFLYNILFATGIGAWYGALPFFALVLTLGLIGASILTSRPNLVPLFVILVCVAIVGSHSIRSVPNWIFPHQVIAEHLGSIIQPGEAVGEYKDGILAFYLNAPVYNLTGLGNNRAYVEALESRTLSSYIREHHISYIVHGDFSSGLQVPSSREVLICENPSFSFKGVEVFRIGTCAPEPIL